MWSEERICFDLLHRQRNGFLAERTSYLLERIKGFIAGILDEVDVGESSLKCVSECLRS